MKFDIVYKDSDHLKHENAKKLNRREAELKLCTPFLLTCAEVNGKWGIWFECNEDKMLVNPDELVNSIYKDNDYSYYWFNLFTLQDSGNFYVDIVKKDYTYIWTITHSKGDIYYEIRFGQEDYVAKIFDAVTQLYLAIQSGEEMAYDSFEATEKGICSCYKQLLVKGTWPSYIKKTTKDIKVEVFQFDVIKGNDGERFTLGIGDRTYSTSFSHWDGSLEKIRHQLETIVYEKKAKVKINFDMSETIIQMEKIGVLDRVNKTDKGIFYYYKDYMLITIFPNDFERHPIFKGYCERIDMVNTLYNGLLRMALDHPDYGMGHVPNLLNAYNMVKSPLLEDFISDRLKDKDDIIYYNRQVHVKHIITIRPDEFHLFEDEKHVSYGVKSDGTIEFLYDQQGKPIVMKDFITWQSSVKELVEASPEGIKYYKDWFEFHKQGLRLVRELRKVLSTDFDIWFEPPVGDQSDFIEHGVLVGPTRNY